MSRVCLELSRLLMPESKVIIHCKLACMWIYDFMTRPDMSVKWYEVPWEHEYRRDCGSVKRGTIPGSG